MPIYEFKCMKCENYVEILIMNQDEDVEMVCKKCGSQDLERILSTTNFSMKAGGSGKSGATAQTRTCSGGSCTTYDIPGPNG